MRNPPAACPPRYPGQDAASRGAHPWPRKTNPDRRVRSGPRRA